MLDVPEEQRTEYLAKGYDVLNANGTVAEATVPSDVNVLKRAYVEHLARIKQLEEQLANTSKKANATPKKVDATEQVEATPKAKPVKRTTKAKA